MIGSNGINGVLKYSRSVQNCQQGAFTESTVVLVGMRPKAPTWQHKSSI
jgi:hypothetical protein